MRSESVGVESTGVKSVGVELVNVGSMRVESVAIVARPFGLASVCEKERKENGRERASIPPPDMNKAGE